MIHAEVGGGEAEARPEASKESVRQESLTENKEGIERKKESYAEGSRGFAICMCLCTDWCNKCRSVTEISEPPLPRPAEKYLNDTITTLVLVLIQKALFPPAGLAES